MSEARKHHYIPQSYLARFGDSNGKVYQVQTIDMLQKKVFPSSVENVASQRDFYRVESAEDPLFVEKFLGIIEGKTSEAISFIEDNSRLPDGELFDYLINFIACLAVRVPQKRKTIENFNIEIIEKTLSLCLADETRWESISKRVKESSDEELPDVDYKEMKRFFDDKRYKVEISRDYLISTFLQMASHICELLPQRSWGLFESTCDKGFITNDNPAMLMWSDDHFMKTRSPGFGLMGTIVHVPLTKRFMLAGTFEPIAPFLKLTPEQVATMNTTTKMMGQRNIFFSKSSYKWFDGKVFHDGPDEFVKRL